MIPRVAIIGLGSQGHRHVSAAIELEKKGTCRLVGVCDTNTERASSFTNPFFSSYVDLISSVQPDLVILATPNHTHLEIAEKALASGAHILKEKPLAMTYTDAVKVKKLAAHWNRLVMTCQQRLFDTTWYTFKNSLKLAGKVSSFQYHFSVDDRQESWYWQQQRAGGGVWLNMGWHLVEMTEWLFGEISQIQLACNVGGKREWKYQTEHSAFARVKVGTDVPVAGTLFCSCVLKSRERIRVVTESGIYVKTGSHIFHTKNGRTQQLPDSIESQPYFQQRAEQPRKIRYQRQLAFMLDRIQWQTGAAASWNAPLFNLQKTLETDLRTQRIIEAARASIHPSEFQPQPITSYQGRVCHL